MGIAKVATPHARGSTSKHSQARPRPTGYPACAGIDPLTAMQIRQLCRLPRMRGDRPCRASSCVQQCRATPHARGSTNATVTVPIPRSGYPACAGIDPTF